MTGMRDFTTCANISIRKTFQNSPFTKLASFLLKMISRVPVPGRPLLKSGIHYRDADFMVM